jgi:hypothetical protein
MSDKYIIGSVLGFNTESAIIAQANRTVYPKNICLIQATNDAKAQDWFTNYNKELLEKIRNTRK